MALSHPDLIIVGGGVAGCAAALRAVQYHLRTIWIRGDKRTAKRSRGQWVANIDNMIGVHPDIVRSKVLKELRGEEHASARAAVEGMHHFHIGTRDIIQNTLERIQADYSEWIEVVDRAATSASGTSPFVVTTEEQEYTAPFVVLATGVMDRQPSIKRTRGDDVLDEPRWIYPFANHETVLYCIRCEGHLTHTLRTAIIGHAEVAAQIALMLAERYGSACSMLTNGENPSWSPDTQRLLDHHQIAVHRERLVDVRGERGQLQEIELENGTTVKVEFALVSLGLHRVYNDLARDLGAELVDPDQPDDVRHVLIQATGETTVTNLYAVGDLARRADEPVMKQVYTAQEYAVRAVDSVDRRIRRARRREILGAAL